MFEEIMMHLGTSFTSIGLALQGMTLAGSDPKRQFSVQLAAIICTGLGAGCLATSRMSLRGKVVAAADAAKAAP